MLRIFSLVLLLSCLPCAAATREGYVVQWGWNPSLQVEVAPQLVASNTLAISAGTYHGLALAGDGTVTGFGNNFLGQVLGDRLRTSGEANGIVKNGGQPLSNVVSVAASRDFSLALMLDGTVATGGENFVPAGLTNVVAIGVEVAHSWILKRDGSVVGWFKELSPHYGLLTAEGISNAVAIAVGSAPQGGTRGLVILRDGTVGCWGSESEHKDATPPPGLSIVIGIAAGASHSLAVKGDGTVIGWGWNEAGEATGTPTTGKPNMANFSSGPVLLNGSILSNVVSVAANRSFSMALKKDGTVVAWGKMGDSQRPATVPEGLSNVVAIAAGAEDFCLAITTNKAVADRFAKPPPGTEPAN